MTAGDLVDDEQTPSEGADGSPPAPATVAELFSQIGFRTVDRDGRYDDIRGGEHEPEERDPGEQDPGDELVVELPAAPHVVNANGGIQGGLIATLIDIVAGRLAMRSRPTHGSVVTSDMNIRYLRAVTSGTARAHARIVHNGRRSIVAQVEVYASDTGDLAALATINFAPIVRRGSS